MEISVVDYIGKVVGGFGILMSFVIEGDYNEYIVIVDKDENYKLLLNDDLKKLIGIKSEKEWWFSETLLLASIEKLQPIDKILKELEK
jgi:hypothetical protein